MGWVSDVVCRFREVSFGGWDGVRSGCSLLDVRSGLRLGDSFVAIDFELEADLYS